MHFFLFPGLPLKLNALMYHSSIQLSPRQKACSLLPLRPLSHGTKRHDVRSAAAAAAVASHAKKGAKTAVPNGDWKQGLQYS
jgi:hypothetical protein